MKRLNITLSSLAVALCMVGCIANNDSKKEESAPILSYAGPSVVDTQGKAAAHPFLSTGGTVTSYSVSPPLPAGLLLDTSRGLIFGIPTVAVFAADYVVTATGPGGSDTAKINLTVMPQFPCYLKIHAALDPVNGLAKTSTISLKKMILMLTSNMNDTLQDTLTANTTPPINVSATSAQTVNRNYAVQSSRTWKIVVMTRDIKDSVIHKDSAITPVLQSGDTTIVSLSLSSRFSMYEAKFLTIPDSISSTVSGAPKQALHLNRLVWKIDGVTKVDSTVTPGSYFSALATAILSFDYVTAGTHSVQLLAYGPMNSWDVANPLFSGSATLNVSAGTDTAVGLTLNWAGPATGTGQISGAIGRVSKVSWAIPGP